MKIALKITNIVWDIDDEDDCTLKPSNLPSSIDMTIDNADLDYDYLEDYIADELSEAYGWCVKDFMYEIV